MGSKTIVLIYHLILKVPCDWVSGNISVVVSIFQRPKCGRADNDFGISYAVSMPPIMSLQLSYHLNILTPIPPPVPCPFVPIYSILHLIKFIIFISVSNTCINNFMIRNYLIYFTSYRVQRSSIIWDCFIV